MDAGAREPWIPDFSDNSPWRWEWWKVGLQPEDLFTKLDAQFNTAPYRIQDDAAFHHDVSNAAHDAKDVDDFYAKLALRRDERLQELRKAWNSTSIKIICSPTTFGDDLDRLVHWGAFQHFTSSRSLDSIVLFFNSFLQNTPPAPPQLQGTRLAHSPPRAGADCPGSSSLANTATPPSPRAASPPVPTTKARRQPRPSPPRGTARRSPPPSAPLTKNARVSKKSQRGRPSRPPAAPSDVKQKPARKPKALAVTQTRSSRRLAGRAPEFGGS